MFRLVVNVLAVERAHPPLYSKQCLLRSIQCQKVFCSLYIAHSNRVTILVKHRKNSKMLCNLIDTFYLIFMGFSILIIIIF